MSGGSINSGRAREKERDPIDEMYSEGFLGRDKLLEPAMRRDPAIVNRFDSLW